METNPTGQQSVRLPFKIKKVKVTPTRIYRAATGKWEDITLWWYIKNVHYPNMINKIKKMFKIKGDK